MRVFSIIVACLAIVAGVACISIVSKFRAMYEDIGVTLPNITITFLNTSGWVPGGIFFISAILLIILVIVKKTKIAAIIAAFTLLLLIGSSVVLPTVLLTPLSQIIRDSETIQKNQEAEQEAPGKP